MLLFEKNEKWNNIIITIINSFFLSYILWVTLHVMAHVRTKPNFQVIIRTRLKNLCAPLFISCFPKVDPQSHN